MDLLTDIGLFVLFLLEYGVYIFAAGKITKLLQADPTRFLSPWFGQILALLSVAHIGLSLLLLARVFSVVLLGLILAVYEFGLLVGLVIHKLFDTGVTRSWLFGVELGVRHKIAMLSSWGIFGIVTLLGYPIAVGVVYFSLAKGSEELLFWVVALTAGQVVLAVVLQLVMNVAAVLNRYLDEDTRTQTLIAELMSIPQPALWLTIAYWASREGEGGIGHGDQGAFTFVLIALIVVVVTFTVGPYLVGAYGARRARTGLLEREHHWWSRLSEAARIPMRPGYESDLQSLADDVEREREAFATEHETFFELVEQLRDPATRKDLLPAGVGVPRGFDAELEELLGSDPRTRFDATLTRIDNSTGELLGEVKEDGLGSGRELAKAWAEAARDYRDEAQKAAEAAKKTPARGRAAISFLFTPLIGVVLDQFGAWIWDELSTLTS
jgi:hypothetical protein